MTSKADKLRRNGRLPSLIADLTWYALKVPPNKEFAAQDILERRNIATFCPFESRWRRKSQYTKEKVLKHFPIMPRYVFAGFDLDEKEHEQVSWYHVFQIPLITSVVGVNDAPAKLRTMADFITKFSNGLRRPNEEKLMRSNREYKIGDLAIIAEGALAGRSVVVENIEGKHAYFRMEMFGADMLLNVPIGNLEAA